MIRVVPWLVFLLLPALASAAIRLEPEVPRLGEKALLRLESAPADSTDHPVGLNAAVRPTEDPLIFEFVPLRVGSVGVVMPATSDTVRFTVPATIEDPRPELLRPLRFVGELGPHWGLTAAAALAVLAAVAALVAWWFRRRRSPQVEVPVPLEPAEVIAMRELDALEREQLVQARRFEEFYVRGSHILREYAGRRYELPVLDWTTRETLEALYDLPKAQPQAGRVAPLLNAADEVKFARHEPQVEDGLHWMREARLYVESTLAVEDPGPDHEEEDPGSGGEIAGVST